MKRLLKAFMNRKNKVLTSFSSRIEDEDVALDDAVDVALDDALDDDPEKHARGRRDVQ